MTTTYHHNGGIVSLHSTSCGLVGLYYYYGLQTRRYICAMKPKKIPTKMLAVLTNGMEYAGSVLIVARTVMYVVNGVVMRSLVSFISHED
jgi:hypothetical protein